MSGVFLMSSREAFFPPLAVENCFSHTFSSARSVVDCVDNLSLIAGSIVTV
jgi:hypothetical protein